MATYLKFRLNSTGFGGLFQINGRGPWRSEYKTDSLLSNGTYEVRDSAERTAGTWEQGTMGHTLKVAPVTVEFCADDTFRVVA